MSLVEEQTNLWGDTWKEGDVQAHAKFEAVITQVRDDAFRWRQEHTDTWAIFLKDYRKICQAPRWKALAGSFKKKTSIGVDGLSFQEIKLLPDPIVQEFADLAYEAVVDSALPTKQLMALLHLLAKKLAGYRTIATLATFLRMLMKSLAPWLRAWDKSTARPGDTAAPGRRSDLGVFIRQARLEAASLQGHCTIQILWDLEQFYESIEPEVPGIHDRGRFPFDHWGPGHAIQLCA